MTKNLARHCLTKSKSLPQKFEAVLPTTEEIEAELSQFTSEDSIKEIKDND